MPKSLGVVGIWQRMVAAEIGESFVEGGGDQVGPIGIGS